MNLTLRRASMSALGIFGHYFDETENLICVTAEHSYDGVPKLAPGTYTCKRGIHRLSDGVPFEAFEVLNVPDFQGKPVTGILAGHPGNDPQKDSRGCVLTGTTTVDHIITDSRAAFKRFMALQDGVDEFQLTVK